MDMISHRHVYPTTLTINSDAGSLRSKIGKTKMSTSSTVSTLGGFLVGGSVVRYHMSLMSISNTLPGLRNRTGSMAGCTLTLAAPTGYYIVVDISSKICPV